eukprot:UN16585
MNLIFVSLKKAKKHDFFSSLNKLKDEKVNFICEINFIY